MPNHQVMAHVLSAAAALTAAGLLFHSAPAHALNATENASTTSLQSVSPSFKIYDQISFANSPTMKDCGLSSGTILMSKKYIFGGDPNNYDSAKLNYMAGKIASENLKYVVIDIEDWRDS